MEGDRKEDSCAPQRARGQQQQVADGGLAQDGHGRRGPYGERREGALGSQPVGTSASSCAT